MEFDIMAGINAVHTLPAGQGLRSLAVDGFAIYLQANPGDSFRLGVEPLFEPDHVPGRCLIWKSISQRDVILILTAIMQFSARHFAEPNDELVAATSELLAEIGNFLGN
jgi:hypothetical protein